MSDTLRANTLIKIDTIYTIIAKDRGYNSTDFSPNRGNLNSIAGSIKSGAPFHTSVSVQTDTGRDITFVFSEKTKLEEANC